ncbi:MAG: hypothetical protein WAQ05_25740 [Rubrivivax sp.]
MPANLHLRLAPAAGTLVSGNGDRFRLGPGPAALLILRECMHHLGFDTVMVVPG